MIDGFQTNLNSTEYEIMKLHTRLMKSNKNMWNEIFDFNREVLIIIENNFASKYPLVELDIESRLMEQRQRLVEFKKKDYTNKQIIPFDVIQICLILAEMVPNEYLHYAGTGFTDFIQPIFLEV